MTDTELISRVMGVLDPGVAEIHGLRRGGRLLVALPTDREAAAKALGLYQPQRFLARGMVALLRGLIRIGQHRMILPEVRVSCEAVTLTPALTGIERGTCGVMLGSPEHRVRRAIACYRKTGTWEIAKISFGAAGARVLEQEAAALDEIHAVADGVPRLLGLHQTEGITVLRMEYLTGKAIGPGESGEALRLLGRWITNREPQPLTDFPEWNSIESALSNDEAGRQTLERLSRERLRPVICHGDFARWNLLQREAGGLVVLDWEWGHSHGLPGIDLVHYFLQDARLVERLSPARAIEKTCQALESPDCREYLQKTGWSGDPRLPMIACLAYKQGAGHQENGEVLRVAVNAIR
jgi:hypothetical protein